MTFSQLHYTSCENGLSGYSGFQFCAATAGVPREIMREVERHTIYELPSDIRENDDGSPDAFPVNLVYARGEGSGVTLIARVQFSGLDFSNRSGNYFAHSLVTSSPEDLRSFLPVELWDAPFWQSRQGTSDELPPLAASLPTGSITRQLIADFLMSQAGSHERAAALLTAAEQAISAGRRLLLIGSDTETVCRWIAAASYLLQPALARQMTFSTYNYDPRRCRTHVVGTVSEARPLRADLAASFHVFDLVRDTLPDLLPSPSAVLLARLGVAVAPGLWDLAGSLGAGPGQPLDEIFPVLASAALILGHLLTADEFGTAIEWLSSEGDAAGADRIVAAANGALAQPLEGLPARQQEQLIQIASRGDTLGGAAGDSLVTRLERALVASALHQVDLGKPAGEAVMLRTQAARRAASNGVSLRLPGSGADAAVGLLAWATTAGAVPAEHVVREVGRDAILSSLVQGRAVRRLPEVADRWPALRLGVLDGLLGLPGTRQRALLRGLAGRIFRLEDFTNYPSLGADWLVGLAVSGAAPRTVILDRIIKLRDAGTADLVIDEDLLADLWGDVTWTPGEAADLLDLLPPSELAGEAVASRLVALLNNVPDGPDVDTSMPFVTKLAALGDRILPGEEAALAAELAQLGSLIQAAMRRWPPDEEADELIDRYDKGRPPSKVLVERHLPPLLINHSALHLALVRCPRKLFDSFCDFAAYAFAAGELTPSQIARIYVAMQEIRMTKSPREEYSADLEKRVLIPELRTWNRNEISALGVEADRIAKNSGRRLEFWWQRRARRRFRLPRLS